MCMGEKGLSSEKELKGEVKGREKIGEREKWLGFREFQTPKDSHYKTNIIKS